MLLTGLSWGVFRYNKAEQSGIPIHFFRFGIAVIFHSDMFVLIDVKHTEVPDALLEIAKVNTVSKMTAS